MGYSDKVIDHYENPRNVGTLDKNDEDVGTGLVGAPACGDVMRLQVRISEDGVIQDAKFKTFGCGSAIASSSLVTEWVKGMTVDEASKIKNSQIAEELSLPPVKIHCSVLAEDAVKAAIEDWKRKREARKALAAAAQERPEAPTPLPPEYPATPVAEDGHAGPHAPSHDPPANPPDPAGDPGRNDPTGGDADGC